MSTFDLEAFAGREQRRVERLTRAAYGVGGEHAWFRALSRPEQVSKVQEWIEDALAMRHARLSGIPFRPTERDEVTSDDGYQFAALLAAVPEANRAALLDNFGDCSDQEEMFRAVRAALPKTLGR